MSGSPLRHPDSSRGLDVLHRLNEHISANSSRAVWFPGNGCLDADFFGIFCAHGNPLKRQASAIAAWAEPIKCSSIRFFAKARLAKAEPGFASGCALGY